MTDRETEALHNSPDWVRFDHPKGLFSLLRPRRWPQVSPVGRGAALSCRSPDGSVLMEVLCMSRETKNASHLVDAVVDGLVKYAAFESGMSNGRVIAVNPVSLGGAEKCIDVLVAYKDASGTEISTDYFVAGSGNAALYVALKTPTALFANGLPDFERVLGTLQTPWMHARIAPNLSGGGRPRSQAMRQPGEPMPPGLADLFAREEAAARQPQKGSKLLWIVIIAAVLALAAWYFSSN